MKKIIKFIIFTILILLIITFLVNLYVILSSRKKIISINELSKKDNFDCILVLGASIKNGKPSPMLEDRLLKSIEIYENDISNRFLVSGDHTKKDYDEVNVMKKYLIEKNIPTEKIFMDHAGISTYDSIYRAKNNYKANKIIIVTQKYHMYRALYIAKKLNIDAYGVTADNIIYPEQHKRDIREILARFKDFFKCINSPSSKYLGEVYQINGNGDKTNNKQIYEKFN